MQFDFLKIIRIRSSASAVQYRSLMVLNIWHCYLLFDSTPLQSRNYSRKKDIPWFMFWCLYFWIFSTDPLAKKSGWSFTCLECLDGYGGGIVPESLPHLAELSVAQLPHKLEAGALYLPLVPRVVTQVRGRRLLNLEFVCQSSTVIERKKRGMANII